MAGVPRQYQHRWHRFRSRSSNRVARQSKGRVKGDLQLRQSGKTSQQIMSRRAPPESYAGFLQELKQRIREAQLRASVSVNRELVLLYWRIGRDILDRQEREHWGTKVIDRLAADLKKAFPEMKGFSPRNLKYMRAFAEAWPGGSKLCSSLLHKYRGSTTVCCWTNCSGRRTGSGTRERLPNTGGAATCSCIRLRSHCTNALVQP